MGNLKEVIILGCGPTRVECKYHTEVWGVNGTYSFAKKLDKLFMTDEESEVEACYYDFLQMADWAAKTTLVLPAPYSKLQKPGIPIEIYPIGQVLAKFPTRFFSNSIAYMIAYALVHTKTIQGPNDLSPKVVGGYHKIWLYGIDMMTHSSYIQEKGGVEFWMGIALGMGVEVINTRGSATGKTFNGKMYGHDGQREEEQLKEGLYAPWDLIRVSKASDPQDEWIKIEGEYRLIKAEEVKSADGISNRNVG